MKDLPKPDKKLENSFSALTIEPKEYWLRELVKVQQCPQRLDTLELQLKDLALIAEKFGLYYASYFIQNNIINNLNEK